jgi:hypothetical protein
VKSVGVKFGNDQIFDIENFDEMSSRIEWSKNEFSHSLIAPASRRPPGQSGGSEWFVSDHCSRRALSAAVAELGRWAA